jgi:hypothetical protein
MALIEKLEQAFDNKDWELVNEILDEIAEKEAE